MIPIADGATFEHSITVVTEMCPHFDGAMLHPVLATWTVVHQFEIAGRKLLEPHLEPGEEGIGVHISVDHGSPACVGSVVSFRAVAEASDGRRLRTRMTAGVGDRVIASGLFVQAIVRKDKLAELLERHRDTSQGTIRPAE